MCGIVGFVGKSHHDFRNLEKMGAVLKHRGPDSDGYWTDGSAFSVFHSRLAIQDLSHNGDQPMVSRNKRWVLSFNGEIYNHQLIRDQLFGIRETDWRGTSDTETILALIEMKGFPEALEFLDGMFAIALWDSVDKKLYLAVDRFGEKPMYFGVVGDSLVFGSELKSLRRFPGAQFTVDAWSAHHFLIYGTVPAPESIYSEIKKLKAGHYLTHQYGSLLELTQVCYYEHGAPISHSSKLNLEDALHKFDLLFRNSVQNRLTADVPVGLFLSGGVDSALTAFYAHKLSKKRMQSFTVGIEDSKLCEAAQARKVANRFQFDHYELNISNNMVRDLVPNLSNIFCEPFGDSSNIPKGSQKTTVILSGDGGDELFAGYNRHRYGNIIYQISKAVPSGMRGFVADLCTHLQNSVLIKFQDDKRKRQVMQCINLLRHSSSPEVFYGRLMQQAPESWFIKKDLCNFSMNLVQVKGKNLLDTLQFYDLVHYLPNDVLVKVDRSTMAHSIESRSPFLNKELLEFAFSLPSNLRVNNFKNKILLREAAMRAMPESFLSQKKKGFDIPLGDWMRGFLRDWCEYYISRDIIEKYNLVSFDAVQSTWLLHQEGKVNAEQPIWNLLMLNSWLESL